MKFSRKDWPRRPQYQPSLVGGSETTTSAAQKTKKQRGCVTNSAHYSLTASLNHVLYPLKSGKRDWSRKPQYHLSLAGGFDTATSAPWTTWKQWGCAKNNAHSSYNVSLNQLLNYWNLGEKAGQGGGNIIPASLEVLILPHQQLGSLYATISHHSTMRKPSLVDAIADDLGDNKIIIDHFAPDTRLAAASAWCDHTECV